MSSFVATQLQKNEIRCCLQLSCEILVVSLQRNSKEQEKVCHIITNIIMSRATSVVPMNIITITNMSIITSMVD
ncbi:MAG: hypothetical protein IKW98_13640 [Prevotella sp.]|nr:hypothetical protein [Prevotella sp.]